MHPSHSTPPSSPRLASKRSSLSSSPFASPGRPRTYYKSSPESLDSFLATRMSSPSPSMSSFSRGYKITHSEEEKLAAEVVVEKGAGEGASDTKEGAMGDGERESIEQGSQVYETGEMKVEGTKAPSATQFLPQAAQASLPITLTHTSTYHLSPCSSCAAEPSSASFISLLPCRHLLCPACLTQLVNGVSNDPPRPGMCFADGVEVESFEGVIWKEREEEGAEVMSEEAVKEDNVRDWVKRTCVSVEGGAMEWGGRLHTPPATPRSVRSYRSTFPHPSNLSSLQGRGVVRVDNIPWDIKASEVAEWIPEQISTLPQQSASISILCSRSDGRTLSQLYMELPSLDAAQKLVRLTQGKKLRGRPVSVVLATMSELLEHIFPDWLHGFDGADAREPWREGQVLSIEDIEGLIELCKMESPHILKIPERVFFQFLAILLHFPFHQESTYDSKLVALLAKGLEVAITTLINIPNDLMKEEEAQSLLKVLFGAATSCPAFGDGTKAVFYRIMGVEPPSPSSPFSFSPSYSTAPTTPPSSPPSQLPYSLRSPTLDRVRNSPSSPSPLRYYTSPPPLAPGGEPCSPPSPSPVRRPFVGGAMRGYVEKSEGSMGGEKAEEEGGKEEEMRRVAEETGIELELVRAVAEGLKMG